MLNGRDFNKLGFINSKAFDGNSSSALTYQFAHVKPPSGVSYYRLRQVDKDGKYSTSDIVLLKGLQAYTFALSNIYPNPAKSLANVVLTAPVKTRAYIIIADLAGKPLIRNTVQLVSGKNKISFYINSLPPGSYVVKSVFENGSQQIVSKFVKQQE